LYRLIHKVNNQGILNYAYVLRFTGSSECKIISN
jgi:hypothetical protein